MGHYSESVADSTQAIAIDPKNVSAYLNRAAAHFKLGHYEPALKDAARAIAIDPKNMSAYLNRGMMHSQLGHYRQAAADYLKAAELTGNGASEAIGSPSETTDAASR